MEFYVAKSYQELEVLEEPYTKNGKSYCKVKTKSGTAKEVRVYSEKEYKKLYPAAATSVKAPGATGHVVKNILGFDEGYIIIFNGAGPHETFFEKSNARYHRMWGWYIVSTETVPVLPEGVQAVVLPWEKVGDENGVLFPENDVIEAVREARKLVR